MFICIDIFRWALNANAPFFLPIFHGVHWLHLLIFILETTTKKLQLLQTWVTNTLSCVWLWCTYTFLVEEMKRHQAAVRKHHARQQLQRAPTSRSLCCPRGAQQLPSACWSLRCSPPRLGPGSQQAIKVVLCFICSQTSALLMSPSDSGQDEVGDTLICCHLCQWLTDLDGVTAWVHYQGSLQEHWGCTLINCLRKLPDVINIDFNSRKRIHQKGLLAFMQILTAEPTPRTPVSARPLLLYQKNKSERENYKTGKDQHRSLQLGTNSDHPHSRLN